MNVVYPLLETRSGNQTYFERLAKVVDTPNRLQYYSKWYEFIPDILPSSQAFKDDPDIIHSNVEIGFKFKRDIPLVNVAHHLVFDPLYQNKTSVFQKAFHKMLYRNTRKTLDVSDLIVTVSEHTKDEIKRVFDFDNVEAIHWGVDVDLFKPKKPTIEEEYADKIKLLFIGNLTLRKGADMIPKIMKELDDRYVLFYNSGLRTGSSELGKNTIPLGRLTMDELVDAYNLCDIFVSPSRLEGFGSSVCEAMACEKPVVVTDYSSYPELVDECKGGFLCEMDKVSEFVKNIIKLGEDSDLRNEMGKYNRNKVVHEFNIVEMGKKYERIYKRLV